MLIVWSLIYWVWNTFYMGTDVDLSQILYTPTEAHLWYLYAMIPIYCVMPFFQVMCRHMDERLERAFLILITAAAIVNYIVSLQKEEVYYDLPIIGDRIYSYYIFIWLLYCQVPEKSPAFPAGSRLDLHRLPACRLCPDLGHQRPLPDAL